MIDYYLDSKILTQIKLYGNNDMWMASFSIPACTCTIVYNKYYCDNHRRNIQTDDRPTYAVELIKIGYMYFSPL